MQTLHADRICAVAGSFYSKNKKELSHHVEVLLKDAKTSSLKDIDAIIVPHAGYVYSAPTAAVAYKTLTQKYKTIFIMGSSHYVWLKGASIYSEGSYQTPLGRVKTNRSIVKKLMQNPLFTYDATAHTKEHTLEVQLPFLQTLYGEELQIVPIIIGTTELQNIIELSKILKPYFEDKENLFVISTDLSHYPSYEDAQKIDMQTLNGVMSNRPQEFVNAMLKNEKSSTKNLMTSACGWSSLLTLMYMTQDKPYKYELLKYTNSGESKYGDKKRVVGYGSLRVYQENQEFFLTQSEKEKLLEIARVALYEAIIENKRVQIDPNVVPAKLKMHLGAFVTLNKNNNLRGCIGRFEPNQPLYEVIVDMAIASALQDTRFNKVTKEELKEIELEISVLTPRKKIESLDEIVIGKHGIYIQNGRKNGTFLPQVATEMHWGVQEFVEKCATNKAGISLKELKDTEIFTYEAIVFKLASHRII